MSWNTLSARDRSAFMNIALRHGVTDLAAIKRAYDSLGGDNVMADGGPAKTKEPPISLAQRAAENRRRKAHLFDGLDNLDRPNQMETVLDDLVAARDRYAQTNDISTSWEPVDLNDVSITDNGFVTREGRTGNSFVLPEARVYGRRTVVPEQTSTDDSFLDRFRAARNRVKYGHSTLTKEDRDMIQRGNKIAAAGSAAIAAGVATPYIASYASPILEMVQPSTITDAIAMRMGARVGSYPFAAKTYAGSLTGAGTASDAITEGLKYAYDRFRGDSPGSFGEDLETATSLAPLAVAPIIPGAQRIYGAARGIRRNMPNFRKVGRFIRSLPTSRGFTKYANDASDTFSESVPEFDKLGTATEWLGNVYAGLADWVMPDSVGNANSDEGNVRAHGGRLNRFDGLDNLDRPNQMETAFDDLVAARDRYAQTGDIGTSWEPVDLNDVSITDNGFVTRQGRVGDSFVLPEAYVYGSRPATPEQPVVARRNDGQESESLLDKLVDAAGSAVAPFLAPLVGTAAAATPSKPFVVNKKQVAGQTNESAKETLHTVKSGENLSTIAKDYGVGIGDIISSNGIANPDFIKPGQQLRIPGASNRATHTVKSGENLSGIAKKYGVSVNRIVSANGIANPDFIKPGQELRIPNANNDTSRTLWTPKQIKEEEAKINASGNVAVIHNYHSNKGKGKVYVIDDKLHNKVHVCKDGRVIKSYNGIHSWNASEDDVMTTTYVDKHGNIRDRAGNGMTPSGVFFLSRTNNYHGAPAFMRRTQEQVRNGSKKGVPNSIHLRTMKENAVTNGCTGMDATSLRDFASRVPDGTPCYILPANSDNKFFIRNGELQFHSSDTSKVPAYNVKTSTPIERITAKVNGLSDTQRSVINGFSNGLIKNKSRLQRELGLNDDTYDRLALLALGILGRESNFGKENSAIGNLARAANKYFNPNSSSPDYKSKYATYHVNDDNNSIGLTQIRFSKLSPEERKLFDAFGITKDSLVYEPEKAAIATLIRLGYDYVNTGQNFDNTVAHWNWGREGYVDQVKDIVDKRFEIYKKYGSNGK